MFQDAADDDDQMSATVRRHSTAVPKHPNLRVCNYCERQYCIKPDLHETTITIGRHLEKCLAEEH